MRLRRAKFLTGNIILPGDKSISHRAAMIAALASGETRIDNFSTSADCASTIECIEALGVTVIRDGSSITVTGAGSKGFARPLAPLNCGNSGTTMRLIAGIVAGQDFETKLVGDDSLEQRPMDRIVNPLTEMGAVIGSVGGKAPLTITGKRPLAAIKYRPPIASAQIKSCILLAGLLASGETVVTEAVRTRDHTERMFRWFGADVSVTNTADGSAISVRGNATLTGRDLQIPSDISSAAFFIVAAVCLPGSDITIPHLGINPSRSGILHLLIRAGFNVQIAGADEVCNEPVATVRIRGRVDTAIGRAAIKLDGPVIAELIDEIPVLAVLGTQLENGIEIRGAGELRLKESDRIAAIVENLTRMGAVVTEFPDGFKVGRSRLRGAAVDAFGDHRIAMAFGVAGLFAEGETRIDGRECADISFPGFFELLDSVVR